jgi:hypothetical protein
VITNFLLGVGLALGQTNQPSTIVLPNGNQPPAGVAKADPPKPEIIPAPAGGPATPQSPAPPAEEKKENGDKKECEKKEDEPKKQ